MFAGVIPVVILALGSVLVPAEAQQVIKIPRVGLLSPSGRSSPTFEPFRQGLADLGYTEGKNVVLSPGSRKGSTSDFLNLLPNWFV